MILLVTIVGACLSALLFGIFVPLEQMLGGLQSVVTALSIVTAAVFVRLNRGMPTLDWKSLTIDERKRLTRAIVELTKEYAVIVAINGLLLLVAVGLITAGIQGVSHLLPAAQIAFSAVVGFLSGLCIARMAYVVWRDFDIVCLQRKLVDESGEREAVEAERKIAASKIADMAAAGLRKQPPVKPKEWKD
ncbi:hypothetical protein [Brevundimonas sp.]|uniref:hypothetical protein n=1 Tax=Brevundimonas sp. TaxID=1871086 RepID=UPI00286CC27A|nr:hypothetical protein [Brevundimonas sp.]